MARSGLAVSRLLRDKGIEVFATDAQRDPPLRPDFEGEGIECETGHHSVERFENADEIVVSPGVPLDIDPLLAGRRRGIPVVSELEVAARYLEGDVVALDTFWRAVRAPFRSEETSVRRLRPWLLPREWRPST